MTPRFALLAIGLAVAVVTALPGGVPPTTARFDAPDLAAEYALARRAPLVAGFDTAAAYEVALARARALPRFSSHLGRRLPAGQEPATVWAAGGRVFSLDPGAGASAILDAWTPLGPGNIGGRTRVIRYHPTRHDTLFAAGVSGGVWRSDDSGASWRPIASGLANIAVNSFAIDPRQPDVMYAGTGEGYFREEIRGTGLPLRGGGIFITRDGGATWQRLASTAGDDFHWVNDLELGADSRVVYAATRTGVWRSLDGGESWASLIATSVRGGCLDLALRADGSDEVLFASCGSYEQATVYRILRASGDARSEAVLSEPGMGRTSLAIAPSSPGVIYAMAASNDRGPQDRYQQGLLAVYRSDRGGAAGTWETRVSNTDPQRLNTLLLTNLSAALVEECGGPVGRNSHINMGWYVNVLAVDPRDPDRVWAAGVDWLRSDDGGRTWGLASSMATAQGPTQSPVHVDQHAIAFHPTYDGQSNQTLIVANDGGMSRTANARGRVSSGPRAACSPVALDIRWQSLNRGYGVTQFYHGAPFPDGNRYLAGAQDNGTVLGSDDAGPDGARMVFGGDGGYVAIDPGDPATYFMETQWANLVRSVAGLDGRFDSITRGLDPVRSDTLSADANYLFITPFVLDPSDSQRLWIGGDFLYRSSNRGTQWTKASTALPDGSLMSAIAVAPRDSNLVIAGTNKGHLLISRGALTASAQTSWPAVRPRDGWVTSVAFDPRDANIIYATYGNFGGGHVYKSTDGGSRWQELPGSGDAMLPDIPVHSLVVDPDDPSRLYLGTDLGVFVSIDGGRQWLVEETGFGPVVTEWLSLLRDTSGRKRLFAFTHGRGAWRVDLR